MHGNFNISDDKEAEIIINVSMLKCFSVSVVDFEHVFINQKNLSQGVFLLNIIKML